MKKYLLLSPVFLFFVFICSGNTFAQCCSGGSGSPIAGDGSQGVLQYKQAEIGMAFQEVSSGKFKAGDRDTAKFLDHYGSRYLYTRLGYGLTKELTLSLEYGHFLTKSEQKLNQRDTITSSGMGDFIIFPRYQVYSNNTESKKTELVVGLGYKIPVGKYNDSTGFVEPFSGEMYYIVNPPSVQPSSGAQDFFFYTFLFQGYPTKNFRLFANATYIKKGWNPAGEKFGDFASIGLFAGKTLFDNLALTLQVRGEWIDKMQVNNNILMYSFPNYDPEATGSRKVFLTPQLNYTIQGLTLFILGEFPVYQYVNKAQIASQHMFTGGVFYRFYKK